MKPSVVQRCLCNSLDRSPLRTLCWVVPVLATLTGCKAFLNVIPFNSPSRNVLDFSKHLRQTKSLPHIVANALPLRVGISPAARSQYVRSRSMNAFSTSEASEISYFDEIWGDVLEEDYRETAEYGTGRPETEAGSPSRKSNKPQNLDLSKLDNFEVLEQESFASRAYSSSPTSTNATGDMVPHHLVEFAHRLADASGDILRQFYRSQSLKTHNKQGGDPVSEADEQAERVMRDMIEMHYPDSEIYGEETGYSKVSGSRYTWVLDPIDGTKSFVVGKPTFGTLIALLDGGRPVLGIINQPVSRERWVGVAGRPTTLNGEIVHTDQDTTELSDAIMFSTNPEMFKSDKDRSSWERLKKKTRFCIYSCDCYGYGLLASGHGGLAVEASLKPYDYCALVPIIEGAGGYIRDWEGNPLGLNSGELVIAAGSATLAEKALRILRGNDE